MSVEMYYQQYEKAPYLSQDWSSINEYNYKDLQHRYPVYLNYQKLFYNTKQNNDLKDIEYNDLKKDPSNIPCNYRSTIYARPEASNEEFLNLHRTIANNSNFWFVKNGAAAHYYSPYEFSPSVGMKHPLPNNENIYEAAIKSSITYRGL